jgi:spore coat protein U-like protein
MKHFSPLGCGVRAAACVWLLAGATLLPGTARADCHLQSVDDVGFGVYDVFSKFPNQAGVGTVSIQCKSINRAAVVSLSTGLSHSYGTRHMRSGNDTLDYNLYTTPARVMVWGDGTGGSSVMSASKNRTTSLDIFGSIPEGQDPAVGSYTDTILISVDF